MAKNYTYNQTMTTKFNIKGILSDDGNTIHYVNQDKEELEISLDKCFEPFLGQEITMMIGTKIDTDLSGDLEEVSE